MKKLILQTSKYLLAIPLLLCLFTASAQSVLHIDYGGKVPTEGYFDIRFNYSTSVSRECIVSLKNPGENWKTYAQKRVSIDAGTNAVKAVSLAHSTTPSAGTGYVVEVKMVNTGTNNQVAYKNVSVSVQAGKQGFHTWGGSLYDANSTVFNIRGINNAHADWDNYNRYYAYDALDNIAAKNFNTVRIQWRKYTTGGLTIQDLENDIARCIAYDMVPMVELHDATGSSSVDELHEMAQFWADNVWLLVKYRKYILVNIANEWSPWGTSTWTWYEAYKGAIDIIRNAGFSGTLVIDAPAYAQDPNGPKSYGQNLISHDPVNNIMFSIHMYAQWGGPNPDYSIINELSAIKNLNIPLVIGEFAHKHPEGCSEVDIDFWAIMRECKNHGFGYIGWSWHGNGTGDCGIDLSYLDVATSWSGSSLSSDWGYHLINYSGYGINSTSVTASVFTDPSSRFALTEASSILSLHTYPNPFRERTDIHFTEPLTEKAVLQVMDLQGRVVHTQEIGPGSGQDKLTVEAADWMPAMYIYKLTSGSATFHGTMIKK